jgi:cell division protein FtsB
VEKILLWYNYLSLGTVLRRQGYSKATAGRATPKGNKNSSIIVPQTGDFMIKKKTRRSREFKNNSQVIDIEEARELRKRKREEAAEKKYKVRKTKSVVTQRQAGKKARRRLIYLVIFLAILCVIAASAFNIINLKLTEARTLKEQQDLLAQKARLERIYSQVNSPEFIEQQARQQLKMIRPGEILYVLPDKNNSKKTTGGGIVPE